MRAVAIAALLIGSGCLSMNTFETARTLDAGDVQHTVAVNMFVPQDGTKAPIPVPAYAFGVGLGAGFDVGIQAGLPGHLRLRAKYNPLKTEYFDLAISPGGWVAWLPHDGSDLADGSTVLGADVPLILDINPVDYMSIVPWAGPGYVYSPDIESGGVIVRAGLGVHFRLANAVRIHPEISTVVDPVRGVPVDYAFGMGISLGDAPNFM